MGLWRASSRVVTVVAVLGLLLPSAAVAQETESAGAGPDVSGEPVVAEQAVVPSLGSVAVDSDVGLRDPIHQPKESKLVVLPDTAVGKPTSDGAAGFSDLGLRFESVDAAGVAVDTLTEELRGGLSPWGLAWAVGVADGRGGSEVVVDVDELGVPEASWERVRLLWRSGCSVETVEVEAPDVTEELPPGFSEGVVSEPVVGDRVVCDEIVPLEGSVSDGVLQAHLDPGVVSELPTEERSDAPDNPDGSGIDAGLGPVPISAAESTTVPATTLPVVTVPEITYPSTTVPVTTAPTTTLPELTVPVTTVPEVPDTTTPESERSDVGQFSGFSEGDEFGVLVVAADSGGESTGSGDYAAAPFSTVLEGEVSLQTGAASLSYPIGVPDPEAGPSPDVVLSYSSGMVDGMNSSTNNQASAVGAGWSLPSAEITRVFEQCDNSGNLCAPDQDRYSIELKGVSSRLVEVADGEFRLEDDPHWRVFRRSGVPSTYEPTLEGSDWSNGTDDEAWWEVQTPDGMTYFFGAVSRRAARSVSTVPVFDSSECAGASRCVRAYSWGLDVTMDKWGNQIRYGYMREANRYEVFGSSEVVSYDRARNLEDIYYTFNPDDGDVTPRYRVHFTYEQRCGDASSTWSDCTISDYTDTPLDLWCDHDASSCSEESPTYWSNFRLGSVMTQVMSDPPAGGWSPWDDGEWVTSGVHDLAQAHPDPEAAMGADYPDEDPSEAKLMLYRIHPREGGAFQHDGFSEMQILTRDEANGVDFTIATDFGEPTVHTGWDAGDSDVWHDTYLGGSDDSGGAVAGSVNVRYAAASKTRVEVVFRGIVIGEATLPATGGSDIWRTESVDVMVLVGEDSQAVGDLIFRTPADAPGFALNWIRFIPNEPDPDNPNGFNRLPSLPWVSYANPDPAEPVFAWLPNRVNYDPEGVSPVVVGRVSAVRNSLGGLQTFTYDAPITQQVVDGNVVADCSDGVENWTAGWDWSNVAMHCYPRYDVPDDFPQGAGWVHWYRYVVTESTRTEWTGTPGETFSNLEAMTSVYEYAHPVHVKDVWAVDQDQASWNVWRGHQRVTVTNTVADPALNSYGSTSVEYRFFQGRDQDPNSGSQDPDSVSVERSDGTTLTDSDWLAGELYETVRIDADGGWSARDWTVFETRETVPRSDDKEAAWFVAPSGETSHDEVAGTVTTTEYGYDDYGNVVHEKYVGDPNNAADGQRSISRGFAYNPDEWIMDRVRWEGLWDGVAERGWEDRTSAASLTTFTYDGLDGDTPPVRGGVTGIYEYAHISSDGLDVTRHVTEMILDDRGRVEVTTDPRGIQTMVDYDPAWGRPQTETTQVTPGSWVGAHETATGYDPWKRPATTTNPNGDVTVLSYDDYSRLVGVSYPNDSGTSMEYVYGDHTYPRSVVTRTKVPTDPSDPSVTGWVEEASFSDGWGRTYQTQTPIDADRMAVSGSMNDSKGWTFRTYEGVNAAMPSGGVGVAQAFDYTDFDEYQVTFRDALGRPGEVHTKTNAQVGPLWVETISRDGWDTTTTDPDGVVKVTTQDPFGNVVQAVDASGSLDETTMGFAYNARDDLVGVDHPSGPNTNVSYDMLSRKTRLEDPDAGVWLYTYDGVGNLVGQRDGRGQWLTYTYDGLNRRTATYQGADTTGTRLASWTYDTIRVGSLTRSETDDGMIAENLSFDGLGNVTKQDTKIPGEGTFTRTWKYTAQGVLHNYRLPAGPNDGVSETVRVGYDPVSGLELSLHSSVVGEVASDTQWTSFGQLQSQSRGGDVAVSVSYDNPDVAAESQRRIDRYHAVSPAGGVLADTTYSDWSDAGDLLSVTDHHNSSQRRCYAYDDLHRLTRAYTTGAESCAGPSSGGAAPFDLSYGHDALNNLTGVTDHLTGSTDVYTHGGGGEGPRTLTALNSRSFTYDGAGMRVGEETADFTVEHTYDAEGLLGSVDHSVDGYARFVYSADQVRVRRFDNVTFESEILSVSYVGDDYEYREVYPELGLTESEGPDDNGALNRDEVDQIDGVGSSASQVAESHDEARVARVPLPTATVHYTLGGVHVGYRRGDTLHVTTSDIVDTVTSSYRIGDDGVSREYYAPYGETMEGNYRTDRGYTGQTEDPTGLIHYGARYYDPSTRTFTSPDVLVPNPQSTMSYNRFAYVANNPITYFDPTGMALCETTTCENPIPPRRPNRGGGGGGTAPGGSSGGVDPVEAYMGCVVGGVCDSPAELYMDAAAPWPSDQALRVMGAAARGIAVAGFAVGGVGCVLLGWVAGGVCGAVAASGGYVHADPGENTPTQVAGVAAAAIAADAATFGVSRLLRISRIADNTAGAIRSIARARPSRILMPGGKPIGTAGSSAEIRVVTGTVDDAKALFTRLSKGGETYSGSYKGTAVTLPDGGFVGFRTFATKSPGTAATVDVNIPGIPIEEIKFNP